jgi:hypothetical protein
MAALTIFHRGVPVGTTDTEPRSDADAPDGFEFSLLDFNPLPAFESVAPVVRLASRALANLGFLGPVADPASDVAGQEAHAAARAFWDELELVDSTGNPVGGRVVWLIEMTFGAQTSYWLEVALDEADTPVPARNRPRRPATPAYSWPAA